MIVIGQRVRCRITGFTGIAVGRAEHLFCGPTIRIQPESLTDSGALKDAIWIDEAQFEGLEIIHVPNFDSERSDAS
jgi:hypothetical protein